MITASTYSSLVNYANAVIMQAKSNLVRNGSVAFGNLKNSISYRFDGDILIFEAENYYYYVENGRKPGKMPPPSKLEPWVKKKGLKFRDKRGRFITHKSTAFLIARSIGKKGIKPKPFLFPAMMQHQNLLEDEFIEEYADEYTQQIDQLFM